MIIEKNHSKGFAHDVGGIPHMVVTLLTLRCPNCKNTMKYQWDGKPVSQKKKRCVYCPKSYSVKGNIVGQQF